MTNRLRMSVAALTLLFGATYALSYAGFLGPYGAPGDNLHLLILTSVLFFTFLIFMSVVMQGRRSL